MLCRMDNPKSGKTCNLEIHPSDWFLIFHPCCKASAAPAFSNLHQTGQHMCESFLLLPSSAQVIKILPNSKAWEHLQPQTAQQLGLHPRDVSLFTSDRKLTPQRATITVRDGMILFKTEAVRAIISADKALLITSRCDQKEHSLISCCSYDTL